MNPTSKKLLALYDSLPPEKRKIVDWLLRVYEEAITNLAVAK